MIAVYVVGLILYVLVFQWCVSGIRESVLGEEQHPAGAQDFGHAR